jgi:16S rRNA (uracil1498-N3)-methyltransferase
MGVHPPVISGEQVYLPSFSPGQKHLELSGSEHHHLVRVRRYQAGDNIWVVNGEGVSALASIADLNDSALTLEIKEEIPKRGELEKPVTLAIANLKGDHLNLVVEKATELGVQRIIPLLTDHTIKKGVNRDRLQRIAISAMKQSRRSFLPKISEITPFKRLIGERHSGLNLFCHAADDARELISMQAEIKAAEELTIWIGPEGDWSKDEIDLASFFDYTSTGLGPRRLRAETAALHAVGLVSALL